MGNGRRRTTPATVSATREVREANPQYFDLRVIPEGMTKAQINRERVKAIQEAESARRQAQEEARAKRAQEAKIAKENARKQKEQ